MSSMPDSTIIPPSGVIVENPMCSDDENSEYRDDEEQRLKARLKSSSRVITVLCSLDILACIVFVLFQEYIALFLIVFPVIGLYAACSYNRYLVVIYFTRKFTIKERFN